eukprot:3035571-Amphidinium_carterae.1
MKKALLLDIVLKKAEVCGTSRVPVFTENWVVDWTNCGLHSLADERSGQYKSLVFKSTKQKIGQVALPASVTISTGGSIGLNWSLSDACVVDSTGLEVFKCPQVFKLGGVELSVATMKDTVKKFYAEEVKAAELEFEKQSSKSSGAAGSTAVAPDEGDESGRGRATRASCAADLDFRIVTGRILHEYKIVQASPERPRLE